MNKYFLLLLVLFLGACASNVKKDDLLALSAEASLAYEKGDFLQAETIYKSLVEKTPEDAQLRFKLGNVYARQHKATQAVAAYQEAVLRNPRLHKAWHNMGMIQLREAGNSFTQLLQNITPSDPLYDRSLYTAQKIIATLNPPAAKENKEELNPDSDTAGSSDNKSAEVKP